VWMLSVELSPRRFFFASSYSHTRDAFGRPKQTEEEKGKEVCVPGRKSGKKGERTSPCCPVLA
jgi:hypothetical protein